MIKYVDGVIFTEFGTSTPNSGVYLNKGDIFAKIALLGTHFVALF